MLGPVLQFEDLQRLCDPKGRPQVATVERWAKSQGLKYRYDARGGIWTTLDALNAALGIVASNDSDQYDPEKL